MLNNLQTSIIKDKNFGYITLSLVSVTFLFFNMAYWQSSFVGVLFTVIYLLINTVWLSRIIGAVFKLSQGWSYILGFFSVLVFGSLFLSIPISLFRYTSGIFVFLLALSSIVLRLMQYMSFVKGYEIPERDEDLNKIPRNGYELQKYFVIFFIPLVILALWFLFSVRTGEFILSPWQVIPRLYVYVYLLITAITALLLFSRRNIKVLLLVVIIHSFVLHAYLPFVYKTGFGGDKWRHIASERLIMTGEVYQPSLLGDVEYTSIGSVTLPAVFVSGNKTSYGQQWALTIGIAEMLSVDVFWVDYWLMFIMWSVFLPLLLYLLAGLIRPGRHFRLLFAFLPVLFYPLQVFGSITLPVSLGHLVFVFALFAWLYFYKNKTLSSFLFAIGLSFLMYFGYVLYFILIWQVALLVILLWVRQTKKIPPKLWTGIMILLAIGLVALIPFLEVLQGFGSWREDVNGFGDIFSKAADAFGYLSGLVAFLPQVGHIDQGNFLFNQTRADHAPVSLLSFRLWPFFFTILIWFVISIGIRCVKYLKRQAVPRLFILLLTVVMGNYIISWYYLDGN